MEIIPIEVKWKVEGENEKAGTEEESNGTIDCPQCGKPWLQIEDGAAYPPGRTDCLHLRFIIEPGISDASEVHYFNGFTEERFSQELRKAREQYLESNNQSDEDGSLSDVVGDEVFWSTAIFAGIDTLFDFTESGVSCGPVSQTAYFGAQMDASKADEPKQ